MVVTERPRTCPNGTRQALTAWPSSRTVHAPHSPSPHPSLVPVRPQSSRSTSSSRFIGCARTFDLLAVQHESHGGLRSERVGSYSCQLASVIAVRA